MAESVGSSYSRGLQIQGLHVDTSIEELVLYRHLGARRHEGAATGGSGGVQFRASSVGSARRADALREGLDGSVLVEERRDECGGWQGQQVTGLKGIFAKQSKLRLCNFQYRGLINNKVIDFFLQKATVIDKKLPQYNIVRYSNHACAAFIGADPRSKSQGAHLLIPPLPSLFFLLHPLHLQMKYWGRLQ